VYGDYVGNLLKKFIENCLKLCGNDMIVYKVHCLIHLADDAKKYGALDKWTGLVVFLLKTLGALIRMVWKPGRPLW
jgi:hypothetical protein